MIQRPNSYQEVIATFGNPDDYGEEDGTFRQADWEQTILTKILLPASLTMCYTKADGSPIIRTAVRCHILIAEMLAEIYNQIYTEGLWSYLSPFGGDFNFRTKRMNSQQLSMHSFGIAVDHLSLEKIGSNAVLSTKSYVRPVEQKILHEIVEIFKRYNWTWGGDWLGNTDPIHLQFASEV